MFYFVFPKDQLRQLRPRRAGNLYGKAYWIEDEERDFSRFLYDGLLETVYTEKNIKSIPLAHSFFVFIKSNVTDNSSLVIQELLGEYGFKK
ncbi:MAG: hypothetical protein NZ480_00940, partial [Bdellovibrionaceae bacterium]|nr:hypothetical protein [Pseudobdellovibrionaceae bacterium]